MEERRGGEDFGYCRSQSPLRELSATGGTIRQMGLSSFMNALGINSAVRVARIGLLLFGMILAVREFPRMHGTLLNAPALLKCRKYTANSKHPKMSMYADRLIIGQAHAPEPQEAVAVCKALRDEDLLTPEVALVSCGPMSRPDGIVYSTAPESALANDGRRFVIKGAGDPSIVVAEMVGYKFAQILGIPVPDFAVGKLANGEGPVFACELLEDVFRDVSMWLRKGEITNRDAVLRMLALDVLIANNDRNMNNLLGRSVPGQPGKIEVVAIDFEKARVVRSETPLTEIPTMKPKSFWPTGDLGRICREKLTLDMRVLKDFTKISEACINRVVDSCVGAAGAGFTRRDSVCLVLNKRLAKLESLVKEE